MSDIKIKLWDELNEREITFKTTLVGENITHYVDAFRAFLLAAEFHPDVVRNALGRDDE